VVKNRVGRTASYVWCVWRYVQHHMRGVYGFLVCSHFTAAPYPLLTRAK